MTDFSKIESLNNWIAWNYLKGTLNWPTAKIAYELNLNEILLLEWVGARMTAMNRMATQKKEEVKMIEAQLAEKYPMEQPKFMALPNVNLTKVVNLLLEGKSIKEVAEEMNVKLDVFRSWYNRHIQLINTSYQREAKARGVSTQA